MMNTVSKTTSLQTFTMLLMRKAVHPEFFGIESRRQLSHGGCDIEAWVFRGGHALLFQQPFDGSEAEERKGSAGPTVRPSAGPSPGARASRPEPVPVCMCEVVTEQPDALLDLAPSSNFPCAGERDHEERLGTSVLYMTTIQTETLSEHLYVGTYKEMMQHVRESNSLFSAWTDELGKPNLSVVDLQRYRNEVHLQAFHLRSDCGLVLRTQSMFQIENGRARSSRS